MAGIMALRISKKSVPMLGSSMQSCRQHTKFHRRSPSLTSLLQPYCSSLAPGPLPLQAQMRPSHRPPSQDTRFHSLVCRRCIFDGPIPLAPRQFCSHFHSFWSLLDLISGCLGTTHILLLHSPMTKQARRMLAVARLLCFSSGQGQKFFNLSVPRLLQHDL
jgi:hypothetical protein